MTIKVTFLNIASEASSSIILEYSKFTSLAFFVNEIFLVIFNHNVPVEYSSTTYSIVFSCL